MNIKFERTIAFTGHRPKKLHGYNFRSEGNLKMLMKLRAVIEKLIVKRGFHTFITGMALGIDMWSARIVLALKQKYPHIKLVCAVPCANHSAKWNEDDQKMHQEILDQSDYTYYVSEEPYTPWCMQKRDEWMIDNCNFVVAVWNGEEDGGTWNTIKYARKRQRKMLQLHPMTLEVTL